LLVSAPRPPGPPLFPYTTLFRSHGRAGRRHRPPAGGPGAGGGARLSCPRPRRGGIHGAPGRAAIRGPCTRVVWRWLSDFHAVSRSEEHTSELQSRENLVCRLLLE